MKGYLLAFVFEGYGDHRDLHVLTPSFPTRRSSDLAETREMARDALIERWDRERQAAPGDSRIILTHTNDEVRALNEAARERLRASGELGEDVAIRAERGERAFAAGDRIMFLRNARSLGVKNGELGTVQNVTAARKIGR